MMNEARKALIKLQVAPQQMQLGRFKVELATIADFFDSWVNFKIENNAQLLEAYERFGKLLGDAAVMPTDQAQQQKVLHRQRDASKLYGNTFNLLIIDDLDDSARRVVRNAGLGRVSITPKLDKPVMLPPGFVGYTYTEKAKGSHLWEDWKLAGWTPALMIQHGYLKYEGVTPFPPSRHA